MGLIGNCLENFTNIGLCPSSWYKVQWELEIQSQVLSCTGILHPKPRSSKLLSSLVPTSKISIFHITIIVLILVTDDGSMQTAQFPLEVFKPLKLTTLGHQQCTEWLSSIMETSALIGAILSIIHPELYHSGQDTLLALARQPTKVKEADLYVNLLQYWSSGFSGMSVISNQECPMHRDIQAVKPWYDILATFGDYKDGRMELPNLGICLKYNPGTVVGLAGRVVRHGVAHCTGNRVCLAYYMRDTVHERAGIKAPGWMNASVYNRKATWYCRDWSIHTWLWYTGTGPVHAIWISPFIAVGDQSIGSSGGLVNWYHRDWSIHTFGLWYMKQVQFIPPGLVHA